MVHLNLWVIFFFFKLLFLLLTYLKVSFEYGDLNRLDGTIVLLFLFVSNPLKFV